MAFFSFINDTLLFHTCMVLIAIMVSILVKWVYHGKMPLILGNMGPSEMEGMGEILIQEVFHVYLTKFENAVPHLFLVILGNN